MNLNTGISRFVGFFYDFKPNTASAEINSIQLSLVADQIMPRLGLKRCVRSAIPVRA